MTNRPTRIAQTSREVKKEYKKNGPQLPERQRRQLERAFELDQRAARAREQEERKRAAKKKREDRERKEREARRQLGVGMATQLAGYSHTQKQLKGGMEAFLGVKRRKEEEDKREAEDLRRKLEAIAETVDKDPWDNAEDDFDFNDLPQLDTSKEDILIDDDLDDDTLLEVHDLVMSDVAEEALDPLPEPLPPPPPVPMSPPRKPVAAKDDVEFLRLHGPVNKALEIVLEQLPEPLIELLSVDSSTNQPNWDPPHSLLHKLIPAGLPPHRLRIKVGCTVALLRDLNTSSQLSKSSHLQVLRVEKERLECLVLDGQLAGTKTFLTRVPFSAKYRNEDQCPFQRIQFPIRVATKFAAPEKWRDSSHITFKLPSISGQLARSTAAYKKSPMPICRPQPQTNANPSFKLPGLPASKSTTAPVQLEADPSVTFGLSDGWDDFLDSSTQIARDLSSVAPSVTNKQGSRHNASIPVSTQDFDFDMDDLDALDEPDMPQAAASRPISNPHTESKRPAASKQQSSTNIIRESQAAPKSITAKLRNRPSAQVRDHKLRPSSEPSKPAKSPPVPLRPTVTTMKSFGSFFDDLGLSTQEAVSFFDDDDFSSPTIAV